MERNKNEKRDRNRNRNRNRERERERVREVGGLIVLPYGTLAPACVYFIPTSY